MNISDFEQQVAQFDNDILIEIECDDCGTSAKHTGPTALDEAMDFAEEHQHKMDHDAFTIDLNVIKPIVDAGITVTAD